MEYSLLHACCNITILLNNVMIWSNYTGQYNFSDSVISFLDFLPTEYERNFLFHLLPYGEFSCIHIQIHSVQHHCAISYSPSHDKYRNIGKFFLHLFFFLSSNLKFVKLLFYRYYLIVIKNNFNKMSIYV